MVAEIVPEIKAEYGLEKKHMSNLLGFLALLIQCLNEVPKTQSQDYCLECFNLIFSKCSLRSLEP